MCRRGKEAMELSGKEVLTDARLLSEGHLPV